MKYFITYCTIDSTYDNKFWHSFLVLSQHEDGQKVKVIDHWGFYGLPATSRTSWIDKIKLYLRLDIDFEGNHGLLRHEDLRYIDKGHGLQGTTFEVTQDKFELLRNRCKQMVEDQEAAINEIAAFLKLPKPCKESRIYDYETLSRLIFEIETIKAAQENREPRLKPFTIKPTVDWGGPALNQSYTCKSQAMALLRDILTPQQIMRLTEDGVHPTVPKYSGKMSRIFFHSTGALHQHPKEEGISHFREWNDTDTELDWTLPPQDIETESAETTDLFRINLKYRQEIETTISRLQQLEWLFINAPLAAQYHPYREELINIIRKHYCAFAIPHPKTNSVNQDFIYFNLLLFSPTAQEEEKVLSHKLDKAKQLIQYLYCAIVDDWELETENSTPAALAAYLTADDKKRLCRIVGRTYIEEDHEKDIEENNEAFINKVLVRF